MIKQKNQINAVFSLLKYISLLFICAVGYAVEMTPGAEAGQMVLHADGNGHFRGTLLINKVSMPYVIDTGATITTIPMNLAAQAGLSLGHQIEIATAGGRSFAKTTTLKSMQIGAYEIKNIDAHVSQYLKEVLVGMNTLKHFKITQTADTLTLSLNQSNESGVSIPSDLTTPESIDDTPSRPIKSKVVCDTEKHCVTRFDNE
ncbi:TIGR02281 family clan AA aspartic protease [Methylomonas sp. AM2-LC]|uniref:retropepsin-like aspartic protease family protein n=1 Tax=Methylomonas sp. AM2-LC TaxID=3153301 RepID=UPI0032650531